MLVRNFLHAGEFVSPIPEGLPITVQYSDKGTLQKIWQGCEDLSIDLTDDLLKLSIDNHILPVKVHANGGTIYVKGVLYSDTRYGSTGYLPECIEDEIIQRYQATPCDFKFYAGDVDNKSNVQNGAVNVRRWLTFEQFDILPGHVVPADVSDESFKDMVSRNCPFNYEHITGYYVFRSNRSVEVVWLNKRIDLIEDVKRYTDKFGNIRAHVQFADDSLEVSYVDVCDYGLKDDIYVLTDDEGHILDSYNLDGSAHEVSRNIVCNSCGKKLVVPINGHTFKCSDSSCNSVLYPRVTHLLKTLGLEIISYDDYYYYSNSCGIAFTPIDILDSTHYAETVIEVSLPTAVSAMIPKNVLPKYEQIEYLVDQCNNSKETLIYYLSHPSRMYQDLDLPKNQYQRFITWIDVPENLSDVLSIFDADQVKIVSSNKVFDNPPIFRGKSIYPTGTFTYGNNSELKSFLESYGASILDCFDDSVDLVLIGDIQENINGHAVTRARGLGIPTITETDFFQQYRLSI